MTWYSFLFLYILICILPLNECQEEAVILPNNGSFNVYNSTPQIIPKTLNSSLEEKQIGAKGGQEIQLLPKPEPGPPANVQDFQEHFGYNVVVKESWKNKSMVELEHDWINDTNNFEERLAWSYAIVSAISTVFVLLILIIFIAIWDQHNYHGFILFSYTVSMLGLYVCGTLAHISSLFPELGFVPDTITHKRAGWLCLIIAVLMHFFYLANYLWLTVLNFDLWTTFRSMKPRSNGMRKFAYSSFFAWGISLALVAVFFTMDEMCSNPEIILPDYATSSCFVSTASRGHYVYGPMAIIVTINLGIIMLTMKILCDARNTDAEKFKEGDAKREGQERYSATLFIKLFLMMGGTSVVEFATWYCNNGVTPWYIAVLECLCSLLPVALLKVFCINRRVIGQLEEKYPRMNCIWSALKRIT